MLQARNSIKSITNKSLTQIIKRNKSAVCTIDNPYTLEVILIIFS